MEHPHTQTSSVSDFVNRIVCGNSIELLKNFPDQSVDCILTDPPYGLNKKGVAGDRNLNCFYEILPECHRVLKENSFFITFFSTKYLPELFADNPFSYFWQFILYCPTSSVQSPIGLTKYMSCHLFKKGNPRLWRRKTDIYKDAPGKMVEPDEGFIAHPTPKPKHFIRSILEMTTSQGAIVLDPFSGSGATAVACKQLNRKFIGLELEERYCALARARLEKVAPIQLVTSTSDNGGTSRPP